MKGKTSKALSFLFHGGTGTGKNYASKIIAENMFKKGMQSKYVRFVSITTEFPQLRDLPPYMVSLHYILHT